MSEIDLRWPEYDLASLSDEALNILNSGKTKHLLDSLTKLENPDIKNALIGFIGSAFWSVSYNIRQTDDRDFWNGLINVSQICQRTDDEKTRKLLQKFKIKVSQWKRAADTKDNAEKILYIKSIGALLLYYGLLNENDISSTSSWAFEQIPHIAQKIQDILNPTD